MVVVIIIIVLFLLAVFACCKAASKEDEAMCSAEGEAMRPTIDITKGCCQMCITEKPYYHFRIGYQQIHLCKECFYDFAKQLNEFCRNEKLEV